MGDDAEVPAEEEPACPPGCEPCDVMMKDLEKHGLKNGPNLSDLVAYKLFNYKEAMEEVQNIGFYSIFFNYKKQLSKYPEDQDILLVADPEQKCGANFYICLTVAAKDKIFAEAKAKEEARIAAEEAEKKRIEDEKAAKLAAEEAIRNAVYEDKPWVAKEYTSETQEQTVEEMATESVFHRRPLITMQVKRQRREFAQSYKFTELSAEKIQQNQAKVMMFRQQKDPNFELKRRTLSVGLQACPSWTATYLPLDRKKRQSSTSTLAPEAVHSDVPRGKSISTQTTFFPQRNNATQYTAQEKPISELRDIIESSELSSFFAESGKFIEEALQQNETIDIFSAPLSGIGEEDISFGNKAENNMPELRTFTDLQYSKKKSLVGVDWHPNNSSIVAVSCAENLSFAERVEQSGKARKAYVLVWNFQDLIHPQIVLQSPYEVHHFRFNPFNPNIIAGGCISGQVILWDVREALQKFEEMNSRGSKSSKDGTSDDSRSVLPPVKPTYLSSIDGSHKRPVTDIVWLPKGMEVTHKGAIVSEDAESGQQFLTISGDGHLMIWDLRFKEIAKKKAAMSRSDSKADKDGEVEWNPHFSLLLTKLNGVGELALRKISISNDPSTAFIVTTEEGEIVDADWRPGGAAAKKGGGGNKESEEDGDSSAGPRTVRTINQDHFRPCVSLQRSPFFKDIYLSVGDWSFNIWKTGVDSPIFSSAFSPTYLTAGLWSPTRPGVIILSRADGAIEIWDLTDQSHKPSMAAPVASTAVTSMEFAKLGSRSMLAAGDAGGNLHILEMPRTMRRKGANEESIMKAFFDREVDRVRYIEMKNKEIEDLEVDIDGGDDDMLDDPEAAEQNKKAMEVEARKKAAALKKREEEEYRKLEAKFREELGIENEDANAKASSRGDELGTDAVTVEVEGTAS